MKAIETVKAFARLNDLTIWDESVMPELQNELRLTHLNALCEKFIVTRKDSQVGLERLQHQLIIGETKLYFIDYDVRSFKIHEYSGHDVISKFLNERIKIDKKKYMAENSSIGDWISCWGILYTFIRDNIKSRKIDKDTLFNLELFNASFNDSYASGLYDTGLKKVELFIKHTELKSQYAVDLFLDFNSQTELNGFFNTNLSVKLTEDDKDYGYLFYNSKRYKLKYTYPDTPKEFQNIFTNKIKTCNDIKTIRIY